MKILKPIILALIILSFSGCKKLQENWIVGKWQVETFERGEEPVYWEFLDDNTVLLIGEPAIGTVDTAVYSWAIKSKLGNYVELIGETDKQFEGKWFIDKINSNVIQIVRREFLSGDKVAAYFSRELYK